MGVAMAERTARILIEHQGGVKVHGEGYGLVGNDEAVCFWFDPADRAFVEATSTSDVDTPIIWLGNNEESSDSTIVSFPDFPGWRVHATRSGKTISVALTKRQMPD